MYTLRVPITTFVDGEFVTLPDLQYKLQQPWPDPRPPRFPRQMPSRKRIAEHHGLPAESCWRCGKAGYIDRAHIVDRCFGGLDAVNNLALICVGCHSDMPIIRPADAMRGRRYVGLD